MVVLDTYDTDSCTFLGAEQVEPVIPAVTNHLRIIAELGQPVQQQPGLCVDVATNQDDVAGCLVLSEAHGSGIRLVDDFEMDRFAAENKLVDAVAELSGQSQQSRPLTVGLSSGSLSNDSRSMGLDQTHTVSALTCSLARSCALSFALDLRGLMP